MSSTVRSPPFRTHCCSCRTHSCPSARTVGPDLPPCTLLSAHHRIAVPIQSAGGFVEDEDGGTPHQSAGDGDALLLPRRQLPSSLPYICRTAWG